MAHAATTASVAYLASDPSQVETDLLILPFFEGEGLAGAGPGLAEATAGALARSLANREVQGRPFELLVTPIVSSWRAERVAVVGAGKVESLTTERLRRVATPAALPGR